MNEYTLESFFESYKNAMNVQPTETVKTEEAFYAGAQTVFLMILNSMNNKDMELLASIENSLAVFKASKEAEKVKTFN